MLLILAGVSIAMLTGDNGLLTKASTAKIETGHGEVYEAMQLEAQNYYIQRRTGEINKQLLTYFEDSKIVDYDGKIDVQKLLGKKLSTGNGEEESDVYKLEETTTSIGNVSNESKIASTKAIKIANLSVDEPRPNIISKSYIVTYYNKNGERRELGKLHSETNQEEYYIDAFGVKAALIKCETEFATLFEKAYIVHNGEKIEVPEEYIYRDEDNDFNVLNWYDSALGLGIDEGETIRIILSKDGKEYRSGDLTLAEYEIHLDTNTAKLYSVFDDSYTRFDKAFIEYNGEEKEIIDSYISVFTTYNEFRWFLCANSSFEINENATITIILEKNGKKHKKQASIEFENTTIDNTDIFTYEPNRRRNNYYNRNKGHFYK